MGPLSFEQLKEALAPQHEERALTALAHLWDTFGLRCAFLESNGANAFAATVAADAGVGNLKEVGGMLTVQLTPYREVAVYGVRERPESTQLFLSVGDKELHLSWPGALSATMADERFRWIVQRVRDGSGAA